LAIAGLGSVDSVSGGRDCNGGDVCLLDLAAWLIQTVQLPDFNPVGKGDR